MKDVHAIFVHGIGEQHDGYSRKAQAWMRDALLARGISLYTQEVVWADILDQHEAAMLKSVGKGGSKNSLFQRMDIMTMADALCFSNSLPAILERIDDSFARLRSGDVHIFAHSLGVVLALRWLDSRPTVRLDGLTSFGTNAQLWALGGDFKVPAQAARANKWRNAFYAKDGIGWPVHAWQPQVTDYEITKPFWSWSSLPGLGALSHCDYFSDKRLWSSTMPGGF